ncbi:fumarylacetoacetate hydrolase family protein [Thermodesulfobacteriota bacterium]
MKITRCRTPLGTFYGRIDNDVIHLFEGDPFGDQRPIGEIPYENATLLCPCEPSKIIGVGINYAPHARELEFEIPQEPLIFLKPPSSLLNPGEAIQLPRESGQVEYEGELAVVIGRPAKDLSEENARSAIFGFTCFNDVTARDLQKKDVQFTRSKSFDTFSAVGPWIETDLNPDNVTLETWLNGERKQHANTQTMIRSVATLISFISQVMTLLPGDIIATGTPAGVGRLHPGDTVSVTIEKIGTLTNSVDRRLISETECIS